MKVFSFILTIAMIVPYGVALCGQGTFIYQAPGFDPACYACQSGKYRLVNMANDTCANCPVGYESRGRGATICYECANGKYQDQAGQPSCKSCPTGKYQNSASSCTSCDSGEYQDQTEQTSCKPCPEGYYGDQSGQSTCKICTTGRYTDSSLSCADCEAGTYQDESGAVDCKLCSTGKYSSVGATACVSCASNTYQNEEGKNICKDCGTGVYSKEGASVCEPLCTSLSFPYSESCICPNYNDIHTEIYRLDRHGECIKINVDATNDKAKCDTPTGVTVTKYGAYVNNDDYKTVTQCYDTCKAQGNCIGFVHKGTSDNEAKYCAIYNGTDSCSISDNQAFDWGGGTWLNMNLVLAPINETHVLCDWDRTNHRCRSETCKLSTCTTDDAMQADIISMYTSLYPNTCSE